MREKIKKKKKPTTGDNLVTIRCHTPHLVEEDIVAHAKTEGQVWLSGASNAPPK